MPFELIETAAGASGSMYQLFSVPALSVYDLSTLIPRYVSLMLVIL